MRARETLHQKHCGRCGQLRHTDELIISPVTRPRPDGTMWICLFCVESLLAEREHRLRKLVSPRRASSVPRGRPPTRPAA